MNRFGSFIIRIYPCLSISLYLILKELFTMEKTKIGIIWSILAQVFECIPFTYLGLNPHVFSHSSTKLGMSRDEKYYIFGLWLPESHNHHYPKKSNFSHSWDCYGSFLRSYISSTPVQQANKTAGNSCIYSFVHFQFILMVHIYSNTTG